MKHQNRPEEEKPELDGLLSIDPDELFCSDLEDYSKIWDEALSKGLSALDSLLTELDSHLQRWGDLPDEWELSPKWWEALQEDNTSILQERKH